MGTSQHQGIDILGQHRLEIFLGSESRYLVLQPPLLYQRDEEWTGLGIHTNPGIKGMHAPGVGIAIDRCRSTDHADCSGTRLGHRRAGTRIDHIQHGNAPGLVLHHLGRHRGHGVTGDDEHLHALVEQMVGDLAREVLDGCHRLDAIGHTGRIAKVNDVLEGQALHQRPHDSEAAHAGIEDSDGQRAGFRHGVG